MRLCGILTSRQMRGMKLRARARALCCTTKRQAVKDNAQPLYKPSPTRYCKYLWYAYSTGQVWERPAHITAYRANARIL